MSDKASSPGDDAERNRLSGRIARVAQVGANMSGAAVAFGVSRLMGGAETSDARVAAALRDALGRTKGPLMKVAQLLATIPDALPEQYAAELRALQSNAPAMGWPFVQRRMRAELGADWQSRFADFGREAVAAASLGQVHAATARDGRRLAVKLQYPDMASAVEADLGQLRNLMGLLRSVQGAIDPSEVVPEIGARLREELDYARERRAMALYRDLLSVHPEIVVPETLDALSTGRLLVMTWVDGQPILDFRDAPQAVRNTIAVNLFHAWWTPMMTAGVIHGDPHLGNYSVRDGGAGLNLLDFGCIRIFPVRFVAGVVQLYRALDADDREAQRAAYARWGFDSLSDGAMDALNVWARFIYGPLLDDRVRTVADGVAPSEYGRREVFEVRRRLKQHGPVRIPREFIFMDRAAIGLGAAFLHLKAELNFRRLFEESIAGFTEDTLSARQARALDQAGLTFTDPA
jgi:predicted unusual protein kinase regulating ubiquinone biosynthesis (AarF/ABC1/UbiB family)